MDPARHTTTEGGEMGAYGIWEHIDAAGRGAALGGSYTEACATPDEEGETQGARTPEGCCPLGLALRAMGLGDAAAPTEDEVGWALAGRSGVDSGELAELAEEFVADWDWGRIGAGGLAGAVGRPPEPDGPGEPAAPRAA